MATVSRVLNRPEIVSPDKVKKVRKAMKLLDYRPNFLELIKDSFAYTAVIAATDRIAIGAMAAMKKRGLNIPNDISILGFEGIEASAQTEPPLTTVKIDFRQMGALGVRRILDIIKQKEQRDRICIMSVPAKLVIRNSIGPCKKKG